MSSNKTYKELQYLQNELLYKKGAAYNAFKPDTLKEENAQSFIKIAHKAENDADAFTNICTESKSVSFEDLVKAYNAAKKAYNIAANLYFLAKNINATINNFDRQMLIEDIEHRSCSAYFAAKNTYWAVRNRDYANLYVHYTPNKVLWELTSSDHKRTEFIKKMAIDSELEHNKNVYEEAVANYINAERIKYNTYILAENARNHTIDTSEDEEKLWQAEEAERKAHFDVMSAYSFMEEKRDAYYASKQFVK